MLETEGHPLNKDTYNFSFLRLTTFDITNNFCNIQRWFVRCLFYFPCFSYFTNSLFFLRLSIFSRFPNPFVISVFPSFPLSRVDIVRSVKFLPFFKRLTLSVCFGKPDHSSLAILASWKLVVEAVELVHRTDMWKNINCKTRNSYDDTSKHSLL